MSHTRGPAERNALISMDHASAVEGLNCADLVDAMGRLHRHRCHILRSCQSDAGSGPVRPRGDHLLFPSCSTSLDPERYNLANLFYEAVGNDPEGKVLVLASNGYTDVSLGGGTRRRKRAFSVWLQMKVPASYGFNGCLDTVRDVKLARIPATWLATVFGLSERSRAISLLLFRWRVA